MTSHKRTCDERHRAWSLFLRTYSALVEVVDTELQHERRIPLAWFDVLVHLQDQKSGGMRMNELAESVDLSRSGLTRLVDRMEAAGLIERTADESDRRVVYAQITQEGRKEFAGAAPIAFAGVKRHFTASLNRDELAALESALSKLLSAAREGPSQKAG